MEDETLLASLILLLRLPVGDGSDPAAVKTNGDVTNTGNISPTTTDYSKREQPQFDGSSALKDALERNNCRLLCFAGRLLNHYATAVEGDSSSEGYAYLRPAVRILFLRYVSSPSSNGNDGDNINNGGEEKNSKGDWEYEYCLLTSLLAALKARASYEMEEVDVEIAWTSQILLVRLSNDNIQSEKKQDKSMAKTWSETLDTLMARRQEKKKGGKSPSSCATFR